MTSHSMQANGAARPASAQDVGYPAGRGRGVASGEDGDFQAMLQRKLDVQDRAAADNSDKTEPATTPDDAEPAAAPQAETPPEQLWAMVAEFFQNQEATPDQTQTGADMDAAPIVPAQANPTGSAGSAKPQAPLSQSSAPAQITAGTTDTTVFANLVESGAVSRNPAEGTGNPETASGERGSNLPPGLPLDTMSTPQFRDSAAPAKTPAPSHDLPTPFGQPGWHDEVGEKVVWLAQRDLGAAQLKLNPEHLGPVDVRIQLDGEGASIQFTAHSAGVREALEASVPRLREMFDTQRIALNEVSVAPPQPSAQTDSRGFDFQRQSGHEPQGSGTRSPGNPGGREAMAEGETRIESTRPSTGLGLVNVFA
ncbi:hook-length control protein FliK [Methylomagnum ishizawai]|uniref:Hook-length control protein FliK n=1 Tax=Methylomagnum ishizawai TaxID=1760988 RepID=A0A1Y6CXU7_9GAMM|nr:flagellar hook-length control protein FliK [Methylomagnum ishizawai]SMF95498.1 hook-length control protein FliK [Methylomagnum ishizawai]